MVWAGLRSGCLRGLFLTRRSWYLDFSASTPPADPEVPAKRAFLADFGYGSPLPAAARLRNT
ncbi:MAG: hypothetical protein P1S46_07920 [bacterium]|nr:hypothetical protein [bacterium]